MSNMFEFFKKAAQDAAAQTSERIAQLDRDIGELEKQKAKVEASRQMARGALHRLSNYPVTNGGSYLCPMCWVNEGKMSPLNPFSPPNPSRDDFFRCRMCHYEAVIPG